MTKTKLARPAGWNADHTQFDGFAVSTLERRFIETWEAVTIGYVNIPHFQFQAYPIEGRRFRSDFVWRPYRLIVEVQGGVFTRGRHGRGSGLQSDYERHNLLTLAGWDVLYYTAHDLKKTHCTTAIHQVLRALIERVNRYDPNAP